MAASVPAYASWGGTTGAAASFIALSIAAVVLLTPFTAAIEVSIAGTGVDDKLTLRVGGQDELRTRNPLSADAQDQWTQDVLDRVYSEPLIPDPRLGVTTAYLAKGVDADEDGVFEPATEYDVWSERPNASTPLQVTAYYDFNGVYWHDGVQMTPWDLLFSYHLNVMTPRWTPDFYPVVPGFSYELGERQLNIETAPKNWAGEGTMPGTSFLRVAVQFSLQLPFVRFADATLSPVLLPLHVWSRTGGGRHADFGCAIWIPSVEAAARGIPECGTDDSTKWGDGIRLTDAIPGTGPYDYSAAKSWMPGDRDVVGSGPFRFDQWIPGSETRVVRNDAFFVGGAFDPRLGSRLRLPQIEGISFRVYRTTQLGVFALQQGEIDYYHWNIGPELVPELFREPNIAIESNAQFGYWYVGYNLRKAPWGYEDGDPTRDVGLVLRKAFAHSINKKSIVWNVLQNFGVVADGFVSPANTFWYKADLPKPDYDLTLAQELLDSPEARAAGIGPDPPGECSRDSPDGCRLLRGIGNAPFDILAPPADYDPIRASAVAMWAYALRELGLNAISKPTAFGRIVELIGLRQYDLYFGGWRITGTEPDYLFSFFHSSNGMPGGLNLDGVADPELDRCLEDSRREMNRDLRREIIFRCQEILADLRPAEPLYFRTNIEAYRQDRFVNWTVSGGTIWNFWSLIGLRAFNPHSLRLAIDTEMIVPAQGVIPVSIVVRNDIGESVSSAIVTANLSAAYGSITGNLSADGKRGTSVTLSTNSGGRAIIGYEAPLLYEATLPVVIRASTIHPSYSGTAIGETFLIVVGRELTFLRARFDLPAGDVGHPDVPLPLQLFVRDRWGAVSDALVMVETYPAGSLAPASGTAQNLSTIFATFPTTGVYTISVGVSRPGDRSAWNYVTVWIVEPPTGEGLELPRDRPPVLVLPVLLGLTLSGVAATTAVFLMVRHRRSR